MTNNRVIAKLKNQRGRSGSFCQLFSDQIIFHIPASLSNSIEYDDEKKLEDSQWFKVNDFKAKSYCPDFLKSSLPTIYSSIQKEDYVRIDYIFGTMDSEHYIWFQNVTPSRYLKNPLVQWLNGEPHLVDNNASIVELDEEFHAVFDSKTNTLYFKRLSSLTSIFPGIEELYRDATEDEVTSFLSSDIISIRGTYCVEQIKTANRRRLTAAKKKYDSFNDEQKKELIKYLREYCPRLSLTDDKSFNVSCEEEMTDLLNGINQRYYTTPIDKEKRIANSITVIS